MPATRKRARPRRVVSAKAPKERISTLGRDLRRIREEIVASGVKLLTPEEVEQEVNERRGIRG